MFFEIFKIIFYKYYSKSLLTVLVFLLFFNFAKASDPDVVINEVAWMGTENSSNDEWIELKNLSDDDVDLAGWTLETKDGGIYTAEGKIADDEEDEEAISRIILEGKLKSGKFFLLERTDDDSASGEKADLIYTGSLSNNGEELVLRDEEGTKIDEIKAEDDWPAGNNDDKLTMERTDEGNWQDSFVINGTPGKENSTEDDIEEDENDEEEDEEDENDDDEDENEDDAEKCILENRQDLDKIYLNEILVNPLEGQAEWIELYNLGNENVSLEGCFLADKNLHDKQDLSKYFVFSEGEEIESGEYKVFEKSEFSFGINNSDEEIFLLDGKGDELKGLSFEGDAEKGYSYALDFERKWNWTEFLTPGSANHFLETKSYSKEIKINELMPNPDGVDNDKEWIELMSSDKEKIELDDWYFLNQSNQKFKLDGFEIEFNQRLKIEIKNTSFSIKNSDGWIELFNPEEESVDKVEYSESAKKDSSLNRNTDDQWLWSIFATPGEENKFNNLPTYKVDIPDKIYKDVKTEFKISKVRDKDNEKLKYRWDFGDGSKSYIRETTHVFDKKGDYDIQVRVSDSSVDIFKNFKVTVKNFPELDLKIVKLLPNPEGSDSKNEKIWIENRENKKVNLKNWVIATGQNSKKVTNHYIKDDFKIKAGEIKVLNQDDCAFSLLNKKGRVVLKSPDGKTVDKVKYEEEKIVEDAFYYLKEDSWVWSIPAIFSVEIPVVLGEIYFNQEVSTEQSLVTVNQVLVNHRLKRTDSLKAVFFDNWLFLQSQNYFFKFIFPISYQKRFEN